MGGGHYLTGEGTEEEPNERYITQAEVEKLRNGEYDYTFVERGPNASEVLLVFPKQPTLLLTLLAVKMFLGLQV